MAGNMSTFRYGVLKRKAEHAGHDGGDFNVLQCVPAGHDAASQSELEELCAVAVRRQTLEEQMPLTLQQRAALLSEEHQVHIT